MGASVDGEQGGAHYVNIGGKYRRKQKELIGDLAKQLGFGTWF
jgi:hypothetical protein